MVSREAFVKSWPTEKELEMPDSPRLSVDEGILRLREIARLEWIRCVNPNPLQWAGPEDRPFTNPIRCRMVRGTSTSEELCCHSFTCARP